MFNKQREQGFVGEIQKPQPHKQGV